MSFEICQRTIRLNLKVMQQILNVCLDMKCVYTKWTIYSDTLWRSGWPTYFKWWTYFP